MHIPWYAAWWAVTIVAVVQLLLITCHLWEHRRFARSRLQNPRPLAPVRRVAVFAPCKGLDPDLEVNLRPLMEQDYPDFSVTFVVESAADPACEPIRRLLARYPHVEARLLVAGSTSAMGQKVHNLRTATREMDDDAEVLAFVDSDARPGRHWLRRLVQRLNHSPESAAVTGYRWFVPLRPSWANHLLYSINASVASAMGPGVHHLVWGGSWAIRREVFDQLALADAWNGMLSDDLVAARVLHQAGWGVDFEPACMLASPLDLGARQAFEFLRRQYVVARFYSARWWTLALVGATVPMLAFWGGMAILLNGILNGVWSMGPCFACAALYGLTVVRGLLRHELAELYVPEHQEKIAPAARFDLFAGPLIGLVNCLALVSSAVGSRLVWRGITYRMGRGGRVLNVVRTDAAALRPVPARHKPQTVGRKSPQSQME